MTDCNRPELAYYYPNPVWRSGSWIKNLLLFFDGIALLVPHYMRDKPFTNDPAIAEGLQNRGLLTILEPETFLDIEAAERLTTAMRGILGSGALDSLDKVDEFHQLSWSRLGGIVAGDLAESIFRELQRRGLARPSEDGVSIPMHPMVRYLILVLLSQILRKTGEERGLNLQPTTDRGDVQRSLESLLRLPSMPSAAHVVSLDVETVGVDLSSVSLDEILDFRARYKGEYQEYARDLRKFLRELSSLDVRNRQDALRYRQDEIKVRANDLRQNARKAWKKAGSLALGLGGAVWQFHSGDVIGALLSAGAGIVGAAAEPKHLEVYSYLFEAQKVLA